MTRAKVGLGNVPDVDATQRANYSGTQVAGTLSDFAEAVDDRVATPLTAGSGITKVHDGAANTLTLSAPGGGSGSRTQRYMIYTMPAAPTTADRWSAMPNAATELFRGTFHRATVSLAGLTQIRVLANVTNAGATGAVLAPRYSTDNGATWQDAVTGAADIAISTTGRKASAWATLPVAAQADVLLAIWSTGGNGSTNVTPTGIAIEVKP